MEKKILLCSGFLFCSFLMWEIFFHFFPNCRFILPSPSSIFLTLYQLKDRFLVHTLATLKEMCCGFVLAFTVAFPLAWSMLRFETARTLLQPFFVSIQCLPMFTLAPIMVIWFGWGLTAIVIPTALMIFFPLTLNIYQGLRSAPKDFIEFFALNGATNWQTFFKLRLPWAIPHIFAGFRISAAIAGVGAVAGEWAGAQKGLGILMLESRRNMDLEITFGALFCLTALSLTFYLLILYSEKAISSFRWKKIRLQTVTQKIGRLRKNFALPLLLFALLIFALSGCESEKKEKPLRLLLDWLPNPNHVPLYVGVEKGFFEEEGIQIAIQKMHENGGGISYLTSDQADLLVSHLPSVFKACSKGANLKIAALLIKRPLRGLIYRYHPDIQSISDLSGKILGYCISGPDTAFLDFLLKQGNISPSERKNVSVDLVSAMGTQSVDFIYGGFWNIEPAQLEALGVETGFFKIEELGLPSYYEMIIVSKKEYSPQTIVHFQKALQKSITFCKENPEEAFQSYLALNPDKTAKTIDWERKAWQKTVPLLAENQKIEKHILENFYSWQLSMNILSKPFDPKTLIQ